MVSSVGLVGTSWFPFGEFGWAGWKELVFPFGEFGWDCWDELVPVWLVRLGGLEGIGSRLVSSAGLVGRCEFPFGDFS